jgi:hypothetical protein
MIERESRKGNRGVQETNSAKGLKGVKGKKRMDLISFEDSLGTPPSS